MKLLIRYVLVLFVFGFIHSAFPASSAESIPSTLRIKGSVFYVSSLNFYGILSEDGKKYHPVRNLPRQFQKDKLEVIVEGRVRDDLIGMRMWGKALEIKKIYKQSEYVMAEEKISISLLLKRMDAFNNRDLAKLKKIDSAAQNLSAEQFNAWLGNGDNYTFTLNYVDIPFVTNYVADSPITGISLYSRERLNSMALSGNINYTVIRFVIKKFDDGWKFTDISQYKPDKEIDMDLLVQEMLKKAKQKYGTTNLGLWHK